MSKTYIVSRNGGTVTKAPVNDNKLPIYANETALDADLANIPDNTLVATKGGHDDVINQMKAYIRNQNVLSDWEDVTISTDSNNPTMIDKDGVLSVNILHHDGGGGDVGICINQKEFRIHSIGGGDGVQCISQFPIVKGDSVYIITSSYGTVNSTMVRYYKLRDYKGR